MDKEKAKEKVNNIFRTPSGLKKTFGAIGGFFAKDDGPDKEDLISQKPDYVDAEVWSVAVDIAVNDGRARVTDADIDRAASILGMNKRPDGVYGGAVRREEPSTPTASESVRRNPDQAATTGDVVADNRTPDTGKASKNPQTASSPGAATLVSSLAPTKSYSNILSEEPSADTAVDDVLARLKATGGPASAEDTDWEKKFKEEEDERRKWEKYQSIADAIAAVGVVAAAANKNTGAAAPVPTADMFAGPGRMNLVQAGQGFRLRPFIRGRGV